MQCKKCNSKWFKSSEDGRICRNCGTFIFADIVAQAELDIHEKCCPPLPSLAIRLRDPLSPVVKKEMCTAYMKEVFNKIAEELIKLTSWNKIHLMLAGRKSCGKPGLLKKYYQIELAERMKNV